MGRPGIGWAFLNGAAVPRIVGALAHRFKFATERFELVREFEHHFVLLSHVPLKVGDLFFEWLQIFVHGDDGAGDGCGTSEL